MEEIIGKIKKLNSALRYSADNLLPMKDFCDELSLILNANIYLFTSDGDIFCHSTSELFPCKYNEQALRAHTLPSKYLDLFARDKGSTFNVYENPPTCTCEGVSSCIYDQRYYCMIPIYTAFVKGAGILMIRYGEPFAPVEEILCEYAAVVISLDLLYQAQSKVKQDSLQLAYSQLAVKCLSDGEVHAAHAVLVQAEQNGGTVVFSVAAAQAFVTQSLVSSAVRKLESAGTLSTRSLGARGKQVLVRNHYLREELLQRWLSIQGERHMIASC